jgi:predicted nucleotidyltransferase
VKPIEEMTSGELAAFVQSHLRERGIDFVLSGGACVAFYSSGKYVSLDLDLVGGHFVRRREIRQAMEEIGFSEVGRYFVRPDTEFFIQKTVICR